LQYQGTYARWQKLQQSYRLCGGSPTIFGWVIPLSI
jgi:hypothetical protein